MCSEERAKRVSEARSQRAGQQRRGLMLEQVKLQQQQQEAAAQQALEAADGEAAPQAHSPEERNLVLMIKADVQVDCDCITCMPDNLLVRSQARSVICVLLWFR